MRLLYALALVALLTSCATSHYRYDVSMTHPLKSKRLLAENDTFSISFNLAPKAIETFIYNKSNDGIRINWDEVSFSINGKTYRALHGETGLGNINEVQPPTTIPPKSNLNDFLVPRDKVSFVRAGNRTLPVITEIFPTYDYGNKKKRQFIRSWKGVRITVFMPFYIQGQYRSYYYDLMIDDVAVIKKT